MSVTRDRTKMLEELRALDQSARAQSDTELARIVRDLAGEGHTPAIALYRVLCAAEQERRRLEWDGAA